MVLQTTDLPNHGTTLASIFTPPMGGPDNPCVTRDYYTARPLAHYAC